VGNSIIVLNGELTRDLTDRWQRAGAPIAESLRPGLSGSEAAEVVAALDCSLPPEAQTWWSWQDGSRDQAWPGLWMLPLEKSVEKSQWEWREFVGLSSETEAREHWVPTWLPILTTIGGDHIVIDCAAPGNASPVYFFDREGPAARNFVPRAESIGTMVSWWIEGFDAGAVWWDPDQQLWQAEHGRLDPDNSRRGLV
jgi:cell wall assembly regulator SMI1